MQHSAQNKNTNGACAKPEFYTQELHTAASKGNIYRKSKKTTNGSFSFCFNFFVFCSIKVVRAFTIYVALTLRRLVILKMQAFGKAVVAGAVCCYCCFSKRF